MKQKPELSLVKDTTDLDSLIELFRKVAGRDPTQEEINEAKQELSKSNSSTSQQ